MITRVDSPPFPHSSRGFALIWVFAGFILLCVIIGITIAMTMCSKGVRMADQMADNAPFNAQKRAYSQAEFERKKEAFDQNFRLYESAEARTASLRAEPGFDTGDPLYQEAVRQMTGAAQTARRIASEYNAMSEFADQEIWKNSALPATLEVPAGML